MTTTQLHPTQGATRQAAPLSPLFAGIAKDLEIEVSVPASDVWSWRRLATRPSIQQEEDGSPREVAARRQGYAKQARFVTGRLHEIERLLLHRHNGQCDTDDGLVWFEAVVPFIIERAEITRRSMYIEALGWAVRYLPRLVEDVGLFRLVTLINDYAEKRSDAEFEQADLSLSFVRWLPTNEELRDALRPTWDEITSLTLIGWKVIDRPDAVTLKKRATNRRRQQRHAQGVRPQATRTREKDLAALAAQMGISLSTLKRRMRSERADQSDRKVSDLLMLTGKADRFRSPDEAPSPANDDELVVTLQPAETIQDTLMAANDDTPPPALLTETGYIGQNMEMTAAQVRSIVERHPALQDDLQSHLDAVDDGLARTPPEYRLVVRSNLFRDQNLVAHRQRRAREKAEAVVVPMSAFTGRNVSLSADEMTELAKRYPILADRMPEHLLELEGTLSRIPQSTRWAALLRVLSARTNRLRSRQRFDRLAA